MIEREQRWGLSEAVILSILIVRVLYLVFLSPWELVGDEAYYWECSRHLSLCYYEKGPGLPWLIAASCRLFGESEWAIRLPVALFAAGTAALLGAMATRLAGGNRRAGLIAVLLFSFTPAFIANAQICTQDGPTTFFWALLTVMGWRMLRHWEAGEGWLGDLLLFSFVMGIAFLFKQSILLFVPGMLLFVWLRRRALRFSWGILLRLVPTAVVFLIAISPMIVWNVQHRWPTLTHTLGHLGAPGGDHDPDKDRLTIMSPLSLIGAQLGAIGIPALICMGIAIRRAWKIGKTELNLWHARLWLICAAVPAVGFFVVLSFIKPVIGSWPFPSYVPLVVLVGEVCARSMERWDARTPLLKSMRAAVVYGACGWVVISFPSWLTTLPVVGKNFEKSLARRLSGHAEHARQLARYIEAHHDLQGRPPIILTRYYMDAALDAFYLPSRPHVINAGTLTGQRPTSYDFWPDNDLSAPELAHRDAVIDGSSPTHPWPMIVQFREIERVPGTSFQIAHDFGGLAPHGELHALAGANHP